MSAKFILVLFAALFSVAFAMPAAQPAPQIQPKENMKPAETSYYHSLPFSYGYGAGYPAVRYSSYGYRGGLDAGLGYGYPYYNTYSGYPYYNSYGGHTDDYRYGYY